MCKAWRLLSLHQRSFHCLFHVLPTATPITADSHRQPAYSIQECTFAAYIHVLHSTKHYQNSRKERNRHTPNCSLKQFCKVCCCLQYRAESIMSSKAMPLSGLKKEHLHYSKKHPVNTKITKNFPMTFFFLNRIYKNTSENKAEDHVKRNTITLQKKTKITLLNIFSGNSQRSGLMLTRRVKKQGFTPHSSQFRL